MKVNIQFYYTNNKNKFVGAVEDLDWPFEHIPSAGDMIDVGTIINKPEYEGIAVRVSERRWSKGYISLLCYDE